MGLGLINKNKFSFFKKLKINKNYNFEMRKN